MNDIWLGTPPDIIIPRLRSLLSDLEAVAISGRVSGVTEAVTIRNAMLGQRSVPCLIGEMIGHPNIKDGQPGVSAELFLLDRKLRLGRSLSRWYQFDEGLL